MHPKEYKREKNGTGRMTKLQLENSEIIVGVDFTDNKRVNEILSQSANSSFLLYPGKAAFNLSISKSSETNSFMGEDPCIFLLDGTWPCARKMLQLSTNLQKLRRVTFDNSIKSKFLFKQQPNAACLSTIESVHTVLNLLKKAGFEHCDTEIFLRPFEKMIEYQLEYIVHPENVKCSSSANGKIPIKDKYRKNPQRSVFYDVQGV